MYLVKMKSALPRELLSLLVNSKTGNVGTSDSKMSEIVWSGFSSNIDMMVQINNLERFFLNKSGVIFVKQLFCVVFFRNLQS